MPSDDTAQFLASSPERRQLLTRLGEHPSSPAELADALPIARRTIQRHLSQVVDRGWAEKSDGAYCLTMTGELIIDEHTAYLETLDQIETFDSFFRHLPDQDHTPKPRWLTNATLTEATPENPQAPVQQYIEDIREFETDYICMVSPILSRLFHNVHAELALDGVHTELVMSAAILKKLEYPHTPLKVPR